MLLRDRTKKRLRWFVAAIVVLGCLGVVGYFVRDRHLESAARAGHDAGLKQLEQGDYFHAMHSIGPYVRRHPEDVEALFAYARARQQVPEPNNRHIADTLGLLRRVLTLSPGHAAASESLLELYQECGLMTEALQLSQEVLLVDAKNRTAMKATAVALNAGAKASGGKPADALDAALQYNALWPADVDGQLLTMEILHRGDSKRERAVAHFNTLREKSPNDPLAILLIGVAHLSSGDAAAARQFIGDAARMNMPDAAAVQLLVRSCDQLEMFEQSMDVLKRHAARAEDQAFVALLAGRLWELESYQELAHHFDGNVGGDAQAAALRCLALTELGQKEQAQAGLESLKKAAASNASARDWASVVEALTAGPVPDDGAVISACQQALRGRENPYLRFLMGEAYHRAGDADAAVQSWLQVTAMAPAWSAPILRLGEVTAAAGDGDQTLFAAQRALKRSPNSRRAMLLLAAAQTAKLKSDQSGAAEVFALLDRIAKEAPKEASILPLRVRALSFTGRNPDAVAEARRALDPAAGTSAAVLMQLASVSEELKLGVEQEILERCETVHGLSPALALMKAKKELDAGRKPEALQLVEKARAAATANKLDWDVAWARLLDATSDPRAKQTWIAIADANPTNARMQWASLGSAAVQKDREVHRRILDRLKEQFGDRGLRWRLAHAQWLLAGREANSQNAVEAALVLNELTRDAPNMLAAKLLLADCQLQLGQVSGAIDQLRSAVALQPKSSEIALKLARLLVARGDATGARIYLDRVAANATAPLAHRREVAEMIDAQGDAAAALAALERAYGPALNDPPADLLLADLYRRTDQPQRADAICKRLLESPDVRTIAFAADFYASQGRIDEAAKVLARLDGTGSKPGEKEIILGNHALRLGDRTQAAAHFTQATRAAPANALGWRQLIRVHLRESDNDKALSTARLAQAAVTNDPGFAAFVRQAPQVFKVQSQWPEMRALWGDLLDAPDVEKTLIELVELLPAAAKAPLGARPLSRLTTLARQHPRLLPLQFLAARASMSAGRADEASRIATGAAQVHPDRAAPAQFAVTTLASAGRWPEVLEMARQWRQATPSDTIAADQMIAAAHMALGNPGAARDQLKPHLRRALAEPEKFRFLIIQYARLQAQLASPDAAAEILRPLLAAGAGWRDTWMRLAGSQLPLADAVAWLREVEAMASSGEIAERLTLADAWHALSQRSQDPAHAARAAALLTAVAEGPDSGKLTAEILLMIASLQESQGNKTAAETMYRKALAANPQLVVAQNNLAMILARKPDALDEALTLAQQAVTAAPPAIRAGIYDTLAFVQGQRGDYVAAIAAIQQALTLQPGEPRYQVRLATMLIGNQQIDRAKTILEQLKSRPGNSLDLQKEIQSLQERLERSSSAHAS